MSDTSTLEYRRGGECLQSWSIPTVRALDDGRYKALYHGGAMVSTYYYSKVLE